MGDRDQVAPEFDQFAGSYDDLLADPLRNRFAVDPLHFHRRKWWIVKSLLEIQGIDYGAKRWLDVGCGRGELLRLAGRNFAEAIGCDPSAGMLRADHSFHVVEQKSPVLLPFEDGSVDFVTAVCVYHHVHGPARKLLTDEVVRVLAPGGQCCIVEHNPWNPVTRAIVRRCPVDVDAELLTAGQTRQLMSESRLLTLRTDNFLFLPEACFERFGWLEGAFRKLPLGGQYCVLARKES